MLHVHGLVRRATTATAFGWGVRGRGSSAGRPIGASPSASEPNSHSTTSRGGSTYLVPRLVDLVDAARGRIPPAVLASISTRTKTVPRNADDSKRSSAGMGPSPGTLDQPHSTDDRSRSEV